MAEERVQRRLAAILAADVVGYSRLMQADEVGTLAALKRRRSDILQPLVGNHFGRVVKVMGDGVLIEFPSAVEAVACAAELQDAMAAANAALSEDCRIVLRIGVNLGDVIAEGSDIYGDGVNVAARLEAIADPGSVFVSSKVRHEVAGKLRFTFEDLGERELKNIMEPVRVYRVVGLDSRAPMAGASISPSNPSIAVLPFENMSGDPDQEHFADGLTENIIMGLSRFGDLFVVARHSSFAYKGKLAKISDVCRDLGVRYVLEGSVQRSGRRVRIIAQLIDGTTGRHLWVERYDRKVEDAFALQDEVTERIVGTLATAYGGRIGRAWQERADEVSQRNFRASDYFLQGIELMDHFSKEDNERARECFLKAVQIDANHAKAYAKLAWTHITEATFGWSEDTAESLARGLEFATMAIERDDDEAWGHWALAGYWLYRGQQDRTISEFEKAVELNPNDADVLTDFGWCLSYAGRAAEGLELAQKAMRLNPHHPDYWVRQLGQIYYDCRQYGDAITTLEGLRNWDSVRLRLYQAASHVALGHTDEAQKAVKRALELDPQATLAKWTSHQLAPYKNPEDLDHFREGLRKAGLP